MARWCALLVHGTHAPSPQYAEDIARQLIGTCATESDLTAHRQIGYRWDTTDGGWGLWQVQRGSVRDSLRRLRKNPELARHAAVWLYQHEEANLSEIFQMTELSVLRLIGGWRELGCLFARLHYMREPSAIPEGLTEQAAYYKRVYNTEHGAGTVEKYLADWYRLVDAHL